jgi:hypothetical protein
VETLRASKSAFQNACQKGKGRYGISKNSAKMQKQAELF